MKGKKKGTAENEQRSLEPAMAHRVENLLRAGGGAKPFDELAAKVPGLKLVDLKAAYPIIFKDGKWIVNLKKDQASTNADTKHGVIEYLESFGGFRSVSRTSKYFKLTRAEIRALGLDIRKEMVLSPTFSVEESTAAEFEDPLSEEKLEKIVELLAQNGGVLTYPEIGIAVGNVTKAQLRFHFDLEQFEDGRCELRIPGVVGTMQELRGNSKPELVEPLPEELVEEMTSWIQKKGGSVDSEVLRDQWPHIKKAQLRDHFDVELTTKVKETGKRFYSVTLKGKKHAAKRAAVVRSTSREVNNFLTAWEIPSKGKPKEDAKGAKSKDKGKGDGGFSKGKGYDKAGKGNGKGKGYGKYDTRFEEYAHDIYAQEMWHRMSGTYGKGKGYW